MRFRYTVKVPAWMKLPLSLCQIRRRPHTQEILTFHSSDKHPESFNKDKYLFYFQRNDRVGTLCKNFKITFLF